MNTAMRKKLEREAREEYHRRWINRGMLVALIVMGVMSL